MTYFKQKQATAVLGGIFFCLLIALFLLSGCSDGGAAGGANLSGMGGGDGALGRYVEKTLAEFADLAQVNANSAFQDEAGNLVFYGQQTTGDSEQMVRYCLSPTGQLEQTPLAWLTDLQQQNSYLTDLSEASDGTVYVLYYDQQMVPRLARHTEAAGLQEITIADWPTEGWSGMAIDVPEGEMNETSDDGDAAEEQNLSLGSGFAFSGESDVKSPNGVVALADGQFLVLYGDKGAVRYDAAGTELQSYAGEFYKYHFAQQGERLLTASYRDQGLVLFDLGGAAPQSLPASGDLFGLALGLDADGAFYGDAQGIHRWDAAAGGWQTVVEANGTSLIMPNQSLDFLFSDGQGGYFGLLRGAESGKLVHFYYDASLPSQPERELTVFALEDSPTVRQAIGEFQQRHPEVRVNLRVALTEDSAATAEDRIRALNTELLNGKGPDLLVLDGLPLQSYIEKGVLLDITEQAASWVESIGLAANFLNAYQQEGRIYGLPGRFTLPVIFGEQTALQGLDNLAALLAKVEQGRDSGTLFLTEPDMLYEENGLLMAYYDLLAGQWQGADGGLDEAALAEYLDLMLRLDQALKAQTVENSSQAMAYAVAVSGGGGFEVVDMGVFELAAGRGRAHVQELAGLMGLVQIITELEAKGGYQLKSLFDGNQYLPKSGLGIVSSTKEPELALEFLQLLVSPTVQDPYLYDGFPVNQQSLAKQLEEQLQRHAEFAVQNNQPAPNYSDFGFIALSQKLQTPLHVDQVIRAAVAEQMADLLAGQLTPQQAAAKVVEKTRLYLAE